MNFLQGVQRLSRECGASGIIATTVGASGESQRFVDWYNTAWLELQEEHPDFDWMRSTCSFTTVDGQANYTPAECGIADHGKWKLDAFRCYQTSVGFGSEIFLSPVQYDAWRNEYQYNARRTTTSRPISISQAPDRSLCFGPVPNADGFTIVGEYWRTPSELSGDADIPEIPDRYHMAIVYRAMMDYGHYESAPEVLARGERKYTEMLRRIEADQIQQVTICGALA